MTMTRHYAAFAVGILAVLCATAAKAQSHGLYWRVDTGYAWAADANLRDNNPGNAATGSYICGAPLFGGSCNNPPGELNNIGEAWIAGLGVGYRFTRMIRADVTASYRSGFKLDDTDQAPSSYSAHITSYNVMLNGYVDFPIERWKWFVPYVGAGLGYANNKIDDISNPNLAPLPPGNSTVPGGTWNGAAWQLSAGVSFGLTRRLILDVGYRYLDSGKIETKPGNVTGFFAMPYDGATGKLRSHELQVGLRF
jgi:opacity protein-like surface antigen